MKEIAALRKEYSSRALDESGTDPDPIKQFRHWFQEALDSGLPEPNAMHLCTVSGDGRPSGRVVLLKGVEDEGFIFFTNYQSAKGRALEENPNCCLTFFWPELERQIRIEGSASRTAAEVSTTYFQSRPRKSQIGAWASPQSAVIGGREILEERVRQLEERFKDKEVLDRPHQWGGFLVKPSVIEFWQGRRSRLHDRIRYRLSEGLWVRERLAP